MKNVNGKEIDWAGLDWEFSTNQDLAIDLKISLVYVSMARKLIGKPIMCKRKWKHIPWRDLDWAKNNQQLSFENLVPVSLVTRVRSYLKKPNSQGKKGYWGVRKKIIDEKLALVNWETQMDVEIARSLGVSRERIRQIRLEQRKPAYSLVSHRGDQKEFEIWVRANLQSLKEKEWAEIFEMSPVKVKRETARHLFSKMGVDLKTRTPRAKWSNGVGILELPINWDIPTSVIAAIWNLKQNYVNSFRHEYTRPRAKYFMGWGNIKNLITSAPFIDAIKAEIEKVLQRGICPRWDELSAMGISKPVPTEK